MSPLNSSAANGSIDAAFLSEFRQTIDLAASRLLECSDADASERPAPGKWSRKEIMGHLIDSASNNHGRFVRGQLQDDLVFQGYDQDAWVRLQRYQDRQWSDLVELWQVFNHHLASVMEAADPGVLECEQPRHNLDERASQAVSADQPTTLAYVMRDYVGHLKHHLRQALP